MKRLFQNLLSRTLLLVFVLCAMPFLLLAQESPGDLPPWIGPISTLPELVEWTDLLYAGLVIIGGYLSHFIPGIKKITFKAYRVAAIALIVALMFFLMGWSNVVNVIFSYLTAVGLYDLIFKRLSGGSPSLTAKT